MRPNVWIVKEQFRRTGDNNSEPMDYTPAMMYGELKFITKYDMPLYPNSVILSNWAADVINFCHMYREDRDFIIATGQPTALIAVGHALGLSGKTPRYLVWRREENRYRVLETPRQIIGNSHVNEPTA